LDGVIGDVFLNVLLCCFPDNIDRKAFRLNTNVRFFTRRNHMNLLMYANASIRNTSLLSVDAKATYIYFHFYYRKCHSYMMLFSQGCSLCFNMGSEDLRWSVLFCKTELLSNPLEHNKNVYT
jgi:hypothetical protein